MILGFDLDGVLYKWHESVYSYLDRQGEKLPSYSELWIHPYNHLSKEKINFLLELPILYENMLPENGLVEYLQSLSDKGNTIYYITARQPSLEGVTERYLHRYNFPQEKDLIFSDEKDKYARLLEIDVFVEDRGCFASTLDNVCKVILRRQPWNEDHQNHFTCINKIPELSMYL